MENQPQLLSRRRPHHYINSLAVFGMTIPLASEEVMRFKGTMALQSTQHDQRALLDSMLLFQKKILQSLCRQTLNAT